MRTRYAHGRQALPAPIITVENGGAISGNNDTYYFWLKARNRVGYNNTSSSSAVVIGNAKRIRIAASSFSTFQYEGWMHIVLTCSKTNDYATSRVIYKQELYNENQDTEIIPTDLVISNNFVLNGNTDIDEVGNLPAVSTIPNGFRVTLQSVERVYEYNATSNRPVDGITVLTANVGQWLLTSSNSMLEIDTNATKELFQVNDEELIEAPLENPVAVKYYIVNDEGVPIPEAELELNSYASDSALNTRYYVTVLGYLNLTTNVLDVSGIDFINTTVTYPGTKVRLSKALPAGAAFVVEVTPVILLDSPLVEGTYITLYPKLNKYTIVESVPDYGEPVADIATLKALPSNNYKDRQIRYVESVRTLYAFDNESTLADNGSSVLIPAGSPASGRWISNTTNIPSQYITPSMLSTSTMDLIVGGIETSTTTLSVSTEFTIDLDSSTIDYYILNCPPADTGITIINITGTIANNTTKAVMLELRQNTGDVEFHSSILFPGGTLPILSGNSKTDLFVLKLVKDGSGILKKRAFMAQKDIG